ncbi:MAG: hypothetical protein HY078_17045 [Elusimicrobia bacterium]|nr:hypothetical protein [Elusimicrobiota bacterium]
MIANLPSELLLYLSGAGFLLSLVLWPYLWIKYRRAGTVPPPAIVSEPVRPIQSAPRPSIEPQPVTVAPKQSSSPELSAVTPTPTGGVKRFEQVEAVSSADKGLKTGATITGGISPAVVYLQSIKNQMEELKKEVDSLRAQVSAVGQKNESQYGAILKHLQYISERSVSQAQVAPAPEAARAPEPVIEVATPAPVTLESPPAQETPAAAAPAPQAASPTPESDKTVQLSLNPVPGQDEPGPKRRGPVWPV